MFYDYIRHDRLNEDGVISVVRLAVYLLLILCIEDIISLSASSDQQGRPRQCFQLSNPPLDRLGGLTDLRKPKR